ncbi:metalloprotease TldD [Enterobacteriaceae endosymbiont of Plateumaris sericea]|uniref:metalloprotease TldD n=1 Tax=Enterobacteriaceae endosymbiont of Plateumaris sericea TaxID=2675797 RepID=UPI001449CC54|nr:metalloprotease TldD [Enterobacteriaceae endosymbiont of Plateumaris sericea]QJC29772.1 metalloprotease TldD [Enterobacteriaceae endosymbiont of Plateumaris sericea]
MDNHNIVINELLVKNNISHNYLSYLIDKISLNNIYFTDLYLQSITNEYWFLDNSLIKDCSYKTEQGIGVRVIKNNTIYFSCTNDITSKSINHCINNIFSKKYNNKKNLINQKINLNIIKNNQYNYTIINPINNISYEKKIHFLKYIDNTARTLDKKVKNVQVKINNSYELILVITNENKISMDIRPLVNININIIVEDDNKREVGCRIIGGRIDSNSIISIDNKKQKKYIDNIIYEATMAAINNLNSIEAPSGLIPVVLGNGSPGVLLHEAIGHGLEGDFNYYKTSIFNNKIQKKIASSICTIVDNGTLKNANGSLNIDDEGTPSQYNVLVKNGILKKYMYDNYYSSLIGIESTGNARRSSYAFLPMPRMTNTYLLKGKSKVIDIINSVEYGVYVFSLSGGEVDITSGNFVFSTAEAFLIKKGKIAQPIKNTTLIGSSENIMKQISMIGDDLSFNNGIGTCIKNGQSLPVSVGQPTLKIDKMTVGGTKKIL